jgi:hypothetical protein
MNERFKAFIALVLLIIFAIPLLIWEYLISRPLYYLVGRHLEKYLNNNLKER